MNFRPRDPILIFALTILIVLSACSSYGGDSSKHMDSTSFTNSVAEAAEQVTVLDQGSPVQPDDNHNPSTSAEMVAFRGTVFVATSEFVETLWRSAGWGISDQPIDTDSNDVPSDCTLYPHTGVVNQWVGSCMGNVFIPKMGAEHIAVMLTDENGTTSMIQVAPKPDR